jgi:hypothetical protein
MMREVIFGGLKWYILPMDTTTKNITMSGGKRGKKN